MEKEFIAISEMSRKTKVDTGIIKRMIRSGDIKAIRKTKPTLTYYGVARHEEERIKQLYPKYYRQVYL